MDWYLDGGDWEADYFITPEEYKNQMMENKLMGSARSRNFFMRSTPGTGLFKATIPGCDRTVLLENGEIPDPYYGRNMDRQRWSEKYGWGFRKRFRLPKELKTLRNLQLTFMGIDYSAEFFLNEEWLGQHTGMFIPARFDVSDTIDRDGENLLAVIFTPAPQASCSQRRDRPADYAEFHRCQMSYGWDWARGLVPSGIWDSVKLSGSDRVRIADGFFRSAGDWAILELELVALEPGNSAVTLTIAPKNFTGETVTHRESAALKLGSNRVEFRFPVKNARRWYPNGYGEQPLYTLTATVDAQEWTHQVGFRDLVMHRNPGAPENAYNQIFTYNGIEVFARGLDWVPMDMIFSRMNAAGYERQLRLAAAAGFNLVRVWGGGLVEKDAFYEACDRHGIMVWQEFMHSCSQYRTDNDFLTFKRREGEAIIRKLRSHVALALFCGGNEMFYYNESPDSPIYAQYGELVKALAPDIDYHLASPDLSRPGERHHGPWHFNDHDFYNRHHRLVASEIGCNAPPEEESLLKFIQESDPWPDGQHWRYHFDGARDVAVQRDCFQPTTRGEYCQSMMFAQADAMGYVMEHYRRKFPKASGCFIWQYNESWPTCAFSIIDYYTLPKIAYYRLAKANAPRLLTLADDSWCVKDGRWRAEWLAINDGAAFEGTAQLKLTDAAGRVLLEKHLTGLLPTGSSVLDVPVAELPEAVELPGGVVIASMVLSDAFGEIWRNERLYGVPDFRRVLHLPATKLAVTATVSGNKLTVTMENVGEIAALLVRLSLPDMPVEAVFWSDNYGTLLPGERRTVDAYLNGGVVGKLAAHGWNIDEEFEI